MCSRMMDCVKFRVLRIPSLLFTDDIVLLESSSSCMRIKISKSEAMVLVKGWIGRFRLAGSQPEVFQGLVHMYGQSGAGG